ncbi:MAG: alpha-L-rhamnosidase C-terminal domain-containing protein, partial [Ignavibacteriaceae bacterium]
TARDARIQKSPAYKFYINGKIVGIGPFQGYQDKVTYIAYDVTNYLNKNINIISAICESSAKEKSFLMQLYIKYETSDTTIITDRSWKSFNAQSIYNPHGTKTSNAYHYIDPFESIDSRKIPLGWMQIGFNDSCWENVGERHQYYDKLLAVSKPPFEIEEISPVSVKFLGHGDYDIILGSGYFGSLKLKFDKALPGDTILIRGERDIFPWTVTDWEKWIIRDSLQTIEEVGYVWTDSLQIRGYQGSDTLDASNIKFVAIRYPFDDTIGNFSSSDSLLNRIYEFCKISMKNLNVDYFWDTPQNERIAYEAGGVIQQMTSYTMDRDYALARFATEYQYYEPTWPHEYKMQSVLMGVDSSSNYLIKNVAASALDWPLIYQDGYNYKNVNSDNTFIDNIINSWNYFAYDHLSKIAMYMDESYPNMGFNAERIQLQTVAKVIKENYNKTFYSKNLKRYIDGFHSPNAAMHSSFMPIDFNMVPENLRDNIADYLSSRNMDCGVFGSQFYLWSLYKLNRGEKALELIVSHDKNSWYNMIHRLNAANTCEAWDPSGKSDMSKSHGWGSAAGNMIQRGLMGINPIEPGFKKISIKPQIGNLKYANIEFPTIKGKVSVIVFRNLDSYNIEISIPANTTAKVFVRKMLSTGTEVEVDGRNINGDLDSDGKFIMFDNIGSGFHTFKRSLIH